MKCCEKRKTKNEGFLTGLFYGLIPHIGCIAFIVFAIFGVTTATALLKPLLLNPYFFYILIALSFIFATISAFFYLKKQSFGFTLEGFKRKWKYLTMLYGTTIAVNLILFTLIFPILTTLDTEDGLSISAINRVFINEENNIESLLPSITLQVAIPCPGHAPLITGELKTISGIENIQYRFPNKFIVNYNPIKTSKKEILALDIFKKYKATIYN